MKGTIESSPVGWPRDEPVDLCSIFSQRRPDEGSVRGEAQGAIQRPERPHERTLADSHARSAVGMAEIPLGLPVEIEVEIRGG